MPRLARAPAELYAHLCRALPYFLFAWLAYNLYQTVLWIVAYYVPVPTADYWRIAAFLRDYQSFHFAVLWRQHNEHRIVFPEIVFAFDMLAAHGRMIWPTVTGFLCYALAWGVLSLTVMRDSELALSARALGVLLAGVIAFWAGSALVLAQPFLLQWPMTQVAAALALFCLKKAGDRSGKAYLAAAIAAAAVATYSAGNALLLWPLLLAIGFFIRLSRRDLRVLAFSGALFVGLYFIGYRFSSETNLRALLQHPAYAAAFAASYLSMPFGALPPAAFGITLGLINLALFVTLAVFAKRAGLARTAPVIVLGGFYLFTLLTVFITLTGRMDPSDPSFGAAKVSRYLAVPLMTWADLLLLCLWMSARLRWRIPTPTLALAFSMLLLWGFYKLRPWRQASSNEFANYQFAAMSLDLGLVDSQIDTRLFPMPEFVAGYLPGLEQNRLGVFFRSYAHWLGRNVADFSGTQDAVASGEIVYTCPVEHGVEVVGWVDAVDARDPQPRILLANESGKIIGFGRQPRAGFPVDLRTVRTPAKESWVGFVNLRIPSRTVSAYMVARHGLLPLSGAAILPTFQSAARDEAGAPLDGVTWHTDFAWTRYRSLVNPTLGWNPAAEIYCSCGGNDENTGQAVAEFAAPPNACVIVPILHGPSIRRVSAQLVDAANGTVLLQLPFREHDPLWTLWRVPLTAGVKRLRLIALDNDPNRGQWLAVSNPLRCK